MIIDMLSLSAIHSSLYSFFFFFNDTATTEIYTLSLHDALPILLAEERQRTGDRSRNPDLDFLRGGVRSRKREGAGEKEPCEDRKSTRLNSSHSQISYAVFCLKKKKKHKQETTAHPSKHNS